MIGGPAAALLMGLLLRRTLQLQCNMQQVIPVKTYNDLSEQPNMTTTTKHLSASILLAVCMAILSCSGNRSGSDDTTQDIKPFPKGSYGYDAAFLKQHRKQVIELFSDDGMAKLILSADDQGRVMTSTATGDTGTSFGWLKYDLIASPAKQAHINPYGGEERFWLGPEGGQYSIYFKGGDDFVFDNWQVPGIIDTTPYNILRQDPTSAVFTQSAALTNYSGTVFHISIERSITLLNKAQAAVVLGSAIPEQLHMVAYTSDNRVTNTGKEDWTKEKGLLSIWLLGMFTPSPQTTVIIPFHPAPGARKLISDNYFGMVPPERLVANDSVVFFTCDGRYRSKIGLSPLIAKPVAGSFDAVNNILTLVVTQVTPGAPYVNSKWELQRQPYAGDAINAYNDGPLADGTQMGPFYEIESSSPALALRSGETGRHQQTTLHLQGPLPALNEVAKQVLGIDLDTLKQ